LIVFISTSLQPFAYLSSTQLGYSYKSFSLCEKRLWIF
jgi:hypothetical protein